jgi:hypothetical protein
MELKNLKKLLIEINFKKLNAEQINKKREVK